MPKLIICTVGTSISNGCPSQKNLFSNNQSWDDDGNFLRIEIEKSLEQKRFSEVSIDEAAHISAELNSLYKLGINEDDHVILISTDNLQARICAEIIKECLTLRFGLSEHNIDIKRIEGLQVHNEKILREIGLKNLVKTLLTYLTGDQYRYSYEIILNPTGGFKGIVPFLTILGMLYGRKTIYLFEFSSQLITLPPLPFSFDLDIYNRVRDALLYLEQEVALFEQAFCSRIHNYVPEEHDLFMAFTEPFDDTGKITLSPLAYCLLQMDSPEQSCYVSDNVIDTLRSVDPQMREKLIRLIDNIASPIWRNSHLHRWENNDLLIIKPGNTAERFAGFIKDNMFHVALVYIRHQDYEHELRRYSCSSFINTHFKKWKLGVHVAEEGVKQETLQKKLDCEIEKNRLLENRILELEKALAQKA